MSDKKSLNPADLYRRGYRPILDLFAPRMSKKFERIVEELTETEDSFGRKIDEAYGSLQETSALIERLVSKHSDPLMLLGGSCAPERQR